MEDKNKKDINRRDFIKIVGFTLGIWLYALASQTCSQR